MNNLQIIDEREVLGKAFRIYGDFENPLFLAKDVAEWIDYGISNVSKMVKNIDEDEKIITRTNNTSATFLTEDGLYEVLMQSRKPIAKQFKKQVKEILKSVRKHGLYAKQELLDNPDLFIEALQELKRERAEKEKLALDNKIKAQQIAEMQPKASYYDLVLNCKGLIKISVIAKDYGMSGTKLNKLLHKLKVQYKQSDIWLLYAKYQDCGYTQTKTHTIDDDRTKIHTYWTQKGRLFIYELLKNEGILPMIERER